MLIYDALSPNRKHFIHLALQIFPDLTNQITREQVEVIVNKTQTNWPQWLTSADNKISRKLWYFPNPSESTNSETTHELPPIKEESDAEIKTRIKKTYSSMKDIIKAVASNTVNSLVIAGGAGIGKSYTVNQTLNEVYQGEYGYVFHRGNLKCTHLFRLLWENRHKGMVIVLDDVNLWDDIQTLDMLKAALELKETRRIGWGSEKEFEDQDGETIPRYFDYEGSIIFLTNEKIHEMIDAKNKYSVHLSAIESRSLVMDMGINTKREYKILLNTKVREEGMLSSQGYADHEVEEIMEFFDDNFDKFREVSLRMIEKVARLYRAVPDWQPAVENFCFRKG